MKTIIDISKFKFRIFQYLAAIGVNMGMISIGMHYGWPSTSLPRLEAKNSTIPITSDEGSWIVSVLPMGSVIGDILSAMTLRYLGYKTLIISTSLPLTLSWLLIALAKSKTLIFTGRIIAGIMDGILFTAIPPFLTEIADPEIRGFLGMSYILAMVFGMLFINVLFLCVSEVTTAFIASVISLLILAILPWIPDSPYHLIMKKDVLAAKASLQKYRGRGEVVEEMYRITKIIIENNEDGKFIDLLNNRFNRKSLFIAIGLTVFQQTSGILAIQSYCATVFDESRQFFDPTISNLIYFVVYLFSTLLSQLLVDISGRRFLIMLSSGIVIPMLLLNGTYLYLREFTTIDTTSFDFIQLVAILLYVSSFSFGLNTIPTLISSEIFPSNMKGVGLCMVNICFSIVSSGVIKLFSLTKDSFGMCVPFYTFAIFSSAGMIFTVFFVPETNRKTLEEIQLDIRGQKE
uniref:Putative sugar transporter 6 n=1 Tax=Phaedon cochleariae TaxID=80249 RepID=W0FQU4_PHACE|nr:putative sugar transporter 6 [Phaedon cochleariae]